MISTFFRMRLSGRGKVCVRFGIADPELPLILNTTGKESQTSLRLSKMMQSSDSVEITVPGKLHCCQQAIDSLNGSGRIVGNPYLSGLCKGCPLFAHDQQTPSDTSLLIWRFASASASQGVSLS